ncbi:YncE family protein [Hyphomicrobium facile]|uniref:40-residue YVTN family beta-propeller repeat-containing protein n=1 Tax=Hyphomicrobium facile TaxID=51670 RepID=A0A1I7NHC0_9HYPH|nr:YncE family protein [Hyphomicrobium facile]SFV34070.1 40-residue YVTN family beta-propeller repeat-containing protein [Hyphomicrobium facile]
MKPLAGLIILLALHAVVFAGTAAARDGAAENIYVLSQDDGILSVIDTDVDEIAGKIKIPGKPAAFTINSISGEAFATLPDSGEIAVINLRGRRLARVLKIGGQPFGVASRADGRLFVGDWSANRVSIVDQTSGDVIARIPVGRSPAHLTLTRDGARLYVADREANSVAVIDAKRFEVLTEIPVGRAPFALALSSDEKQLAVANVQSATLSIVDTSKLEIRSSAATRAMPYGVAITHDDAVVLVSNQQGGSISVIDAKTHAPRAEIKVGRYPEGVAALKNGSKAYVANWFSASVSVLDLKTNTEIKRISCPEGPRMVLTGSAAP